VKTFIRLKLRAMIRGPSRVRVRIALCADTNKECTFQFVSRNHRIWQTFRNPLEQPGLGLLYARCDQEQDALDTALQRIQAVRENQVVRNRYLYRL
jgi:hypothetical protein